MTLYQFKQLDEGEQIEAFWDGVLVGERTEGSFVFECRQIDDFYVEYKIRDRDYKEMKCFRNPDLLQSYFDRMDDLSI